MKNIWWEDKEWVRNHLEQDEVTESTPEMQMAAKNSPENSPTRRREDQTSELREARGHARVARMVIEQLGSVD